MKHLLVLALVVEVWLLCMAQLFARYFTPTAQTDQSLQSFMFNFMLIAFVHSLSVYRWTINRKDKTHHTSYELDFLMICIYVIAQRNAHQDKILFTIFYRVTIVDNFTSNHKTHCGDTSLNFGSDIRAKNLFSPSDYKKNVLISTVFWYVKKIWGKFFSEWTYLGEFFFILRLVLLMWPHLNFIEID